MAPSRRKAGGPIRKERIIAPRYFHRQLRKRPDIPRPAQTNRPIAVREIVYRLLNADKHNQERRGRRGSRGGRFHGEVRKYQNAREPSYDSLPLRDSSASIEDFEYTKSAGTSVENLSRVMDAANSSGASYSENSSVSNISVEPIALTKSIDNTRALLKKKSLVQVINNYIKAGIEEGKRRAKRYIRKALSFGVKSGYLIPTDPRGQVIRVSPTLIESRRRDDESRKRRRRARRGEEDPFIDGNEHRRLTSPWNAKKNPRREDTPKPETPPRKKKKDSDSRNSDSIQTKKTIKKKPVIRNQRNKKKRPVKQKKSKLMVPTLSNVSVTRSSSKSMEDIKKAKKIQSSHKHRAAEKRHDQKIRSTRSSRARRNEEENSRKNRRDTSDEDSAKFSENEANERAPVGRRKSTTSREDAPRNSNAPNGNPAREVEEELECPNQEDNNTSGNVN